MASDWKFCKIGDVAKIQGGYAFKSKDFSDTGTPVIKIKNVRKRDIDLTDVARVSQEVAEQASSFLVKSWDVLISMTGSGPNAPASIVGRVARHSGEDDVFLINQRVGRFLIKEKEQLDQRFLYYLFSEDKTQLELLSIATGSANQVNISGKQIESIEVNLPPLSEQKAIAHILGSLDDKIELNRQMNETLEAMAQALFKSWFVDFDPVIDNALAAGNAIPDEFSERAEQRKAIEKKNNSDIQNLFPDEFEFTEEMGWIPKGWGVKSLDEVADYLNGLALQKYRPEDIDDNYLPIVKIAQLREGLPNHDEKASINIKPEYIIDNGDVIFSWSGSLLVDVWCGGKAALNQHLFKVTSDKYPKWFYLNYTKHHLVEFQRIATDKAVTMGHIKRGHLKEALCVIPENGVDDNIFAVFEGILNKQIRLRIESQTLAKLRDTLLPKLMSGELRIPDAAALVEEI